MPFTENANDAPVNLMHAAPDGTAFDHADFDHTVFDNSAFDSSAVDLIATTDTARLPQPVLPPLLQATYKASAEDFEVNELLPLEFTGEGEHLWLHIQKIGMNTAYLAKLLSEWADIPLRDVGYSGLKDRHARTSQWFSLRLPKKQPPTEDFVPTDIGADEHVQILDQQWHNKKLSRGAHRANAFVITLRDITLAPDIALTQIEQHLQHISHEGVPNYFGPQRFGHYGNNIKEALALFAQPAPKTPSQQPTTKKKRKRTRLPNEQHTMALSAARSLIFNDILAARVLDGSWNRGLDGEVFNLNGSGSIFSSEQLDDELRARIASGDIHPTAVMWGTNNDKVQGAAADLEVNVVKSSDLLSALATGLTQRDIKAQRRAVRLPIEAMSWTWLDHQTLTLRFTLPTGSFATSVLASIVQQLQNA